METRELIEALQYAVETKIEHDKARDAYDGYEWGYHGYSDIKKMDDAADEFGAALNEFIEQKVKEVMNGNMGT